MSEKKTLEDKIKSLESVVEKKRSDACIAQLEIEQKTKLENEQFELIDAICNDYGFSYNKDGFLSEINQKNIPVEYLSLCFLYRCLPSLIKKDKESLEFIAKTEFGKKQETKERIGDLKQRIENLETWRNDLMKEVEKQKELSIVIND